MGISAPVLSRPADDVIATSGTMSLRLASCEADLYAAQTLRYEVFFEEMGANGTNNTCAAGRDVDRFDDICDHLIVTDEKDGKHQVVGTYRLLRHEVAMANGGFYTASEFDIEPLLARVPSGTKFLELGRSCVHPDYRNRPTIELLWRGILFWADKSDANVLFGCASLPGTAPEAIKEQLAILHHNALAPEMWRVRPEDKVRVETNCLDEGTYEAKQAFLGLPPLFKGYMRAGCWFSDGAFVDENFNCTDVMIILPSEQLNKKYRARLGVGSWGP